VWHGSPRSVGRRLSHNLCDRPDDDEQSGAHPPRARRRRAAASGRNAGVSGPQPTHARSGRRLSHKPVRNQARRCAVGRHHAGHSDFRRRDGITAEKWGPKFASPSHALVQSRIHRRWATASMRSRSDRDPTSRWLLVSMPTGRGCWLQGHPRAVGGRFGRGERRVTDPGRLPLSQGGSGRDRARPADRTPGGFERSRVASVPATTGSQTRCAQRTQSWSSSVPHIGWCWKLPTRSDTTVSSRRLTSGTAGAAASIRS
jgi:hypothetical protein